MHRGLAERAHGYGGSRVPSHHSLGKLRTGTKLIWTAPWRRVRAKQKPAAKLRSADSHAFNFECRSNGTTGLGWVSSRKVAFARGHDAKELLGLRRRLKVEVMLSDDRLGIARLKGGFAHGPELGDEVADERMPHDVVRKSESLCDLCPMLLQGWDNDRESVEGIGLQPGCQVRLDGHVSLHPNLRDLRLDMDHSCIEADVLRAKLEDLAGAHAGPDSREQAEGEKRHKGAAAVVLCVGHQLQSLLGAQRRGRAAPMRNAVVGDLVDRVRSDPVLLKGESQEGGDDTPAVIVRLKRRIPVLEVLR